VATTVLVVEDDEDLRSLLVLALREAGYRAVEAEDGAAALEAYHASRPDLVVLDIGLGPMDGLEVCRRLRTFGNVPIIFLTSRSDEVDQLVGLSAGADDYVTKPFSPKVLIARIGMVLRRGMGESGPKTTFTFGPVTVDTEAREVVVNGEAIDLTKTEFDVLATLVENPKRVIPREELVERVWGSWYGDDHVVEVHLSRLRSKIRKAGGPRVGVAIRGVGYKLGVDVD
jgi:DNA-binding response OmpR family regulator